VSKSSSRPVARTSKPPDHTGHSNNRTAPPPGFPNGETAPLRESTCPKGQPPRSGFPKRRRSPLRTGCSSDETSTLPGCPSRESAPSALIRVETAVVAQLPAQRSQPQARMPMLEALRLSRLPVRSVSSTHSHLRAERVAVRRAQFAVTGVMSMSRTASADRVVARAMGSPCACRIHRSVARSMSSSRGNSVRAVARPSFFPRDVLTARLPA
jgi:hypothetical protein